MKIRNLFLSLCALIMLVSCGEEAMYDEFVRVPNHGWNADSAVTFDVLVNDTNANYAVYVRIRHNANYPYQNLYLFRSIESAEEEVHHDKVNYQVAKPSGEWLGDGFGALKTIEAPYSRSTLRFNKKGTYRFKFTQGMREDVLQGIEEIGLKIVPVNISSDGE